MAERIPNEEERLAARLKLEAQATRPAFSEALHARICQALDDSEPPVPRRRLRWRWRDHWALVAIAATLLVGVSLAVWWSRKGPGPTEVPSEVAVAAGPDMITGPTVRAAEDVGMLVDSTFSEGQWAYLDHDAQVAVRLLMDQLPLDVESME